MTAPEPSEQPEPLVEQLARTIWDASRADEGTISATGARIVAEALLPVVEQAQRDALTEAARAWTQGQWSNVLLPASKPPANPIIDYANRVGEWLRSRAER